MIQVKRHNIEPHLGFNQSTIKALEAPLRLALSLFLPEPNLSLVSMDISLSRPSFACFHHYYTTKYFPQKDLNHYY